MSNFLIDYEIVSLSSGSTGGTSNVIYTFNYNCICNIVLKSDDEDSGDYNYLYIERPSSGANQGPSIVFRSYDSRTNPSPPQRSFFQDIGLTAYVRDGEELLLNTDQTSWVADLLLFRLPGDISL
jgi:hypothetical protein